MDPKAMDPHGAALVAYFEGEAGAELIVRRDDSGEYLARLFKKELSHA